MRRSRHRNRNISGSASQHAFQGIGRAGISIPGPVCFIRLVLLFGLAFEELEVLQDSRAKGDMNFGIFPRGDVLYVVNAPLALLGDKGVAHVSQVDSIAVLRGLDVEGCGNDGPPRF